MIPAIASQTKSIHVGSGGIMGLHYAPYKVAEVMRSLEVLPGRIDIWVRKFNWNKICFNGFEKSLYETSVW